MNWKNKIVVFDIDGTLADVDHRRQWITSKPKNWKAWNAAMPKDGLHEPIALLLQLAQDAGAKIVLASGRGDENRDVTEQWLWKFDIRPDALYMRKAGDYRKDDIVKLEILEQIRAEHGEPFLWFDDRDQVVAAIRGAGVRVLQVADGNF